jgi:hypothetical protein
MWTVDHEADIASDLSAFHRIDDPMTLPGPRYFELAVRLFAYRGVLRERALKAKYDGESFGSSPVGTTAAPARVSDTAALAMLADDERFGPERVEGDA